MFKLKFTLEADQNLRRLEDDPALAKRLEAARKALGDFDKNPRHPSLKTYKYDSVVGNHGEEVFEAYAENRTAGAYRIFWHYGPGQRVITIIRNNTASVRPP